MSNELTVIPNPGTLMTQATDVAGVCKQIVQQTAQSIQGRKYVRVEGWQSIAAAYGCVASAVNVRFVERGVFATGELRRVSDGVLIATAEGFVGMDEPTWFGGVTNSGKTLPKRPDFAIQAMAQTRAISRVCRSAFAFVVVLIDAKLSTTPAEEMQGVYEHDARPDEKGAGGTSSSKDADSAVSLPPAAAPGGPSETRSETMKRLCAEAGLNMIDCIAKCEVQTAEEMSEADWNSFCRLANKKKSSAKAPA